jgi:hypothetical protein
MTSCMPYWGCNMKILVACEESGRVREAFARLGHNAWSCDLLPTAIPGQHYQGDIFDILDDSWDMMIAHPPCTYLSYVGNIWFKPKYKERFPQREQQRQEAIKFFMALVNAPVPRIAIENPVGIMNKVYKKADQTISPHMFGHREAKRTCLWLKDLPKLIPTNIVEDTISFQDWELSNSAFKMTPQERSTFRSRTFQGIADAMADQWGKLET